MGVDVDAKFCEVRGYPQRWWYGARLVITLKPPCQNNWNYEGKLV